MAKERKEIINQINEKWTAVTEIIPELKELFEPQFNSSINHVFIRQSLFNPKYVVFRCSTKSFLEADTLKLAETLIQCIAYIV